jgi:thioredoxin-like negative regulator of GroEL
MKKILLFLLFLPFISFSQDIPGEGLVVVEFNAPFSNSKCEYLNKLEDCKKIKIDISKNSKIGPKHKIAVVPTLVIFKDGEEVARFQANIMMQLEVTQEEVQEKIEEIIMESF